jgi:C2 domain/MUN domain
MSTRSGNRSRLNSLKQDGRLRREGSYSRKKVVSREDAYSFALRAAFLSHLLQPRAKRIQHIAGPPKPVQRASTSATDLMKDFALLRDSKSTKFPHAFMGALDKRITGVLYGTEKLPEFHDALVKRTFAMFLNEFKNPVFRKNVENSRRVEDLLLIFFSTATKELQKGKAPDDDNWKLMVDRHVALFVRLVSSILKDHDWARERPELATRLQTMEKKLLVHDQDLAVDSSRNGGAGGHSIEVEVPLSYEVKDMPLAMIVSRIFSVPYGQVQEDINKNKGVWTEKAAVQDLKTYRTSLSMDTKRILNSGDFDTTEAYDAWRKAEEKDVSQMVLAIIQSNMELAKTTTAGALPQFKTPGPTSEAAYADMSRKMSDPDTASSYVIDQPVDMSALSLHDSQEIDDAPLTFIPPDPRAYYRAVLKEALCYDMMDQDLQPSEATSETPSIKLLSKQSTDLLTEIALRWRVPQFSRPVLFLDVVRELYRDGTVGLDTVDAAFVFMKEPQHDKKAARRSMLLQENLFDWNKWAVADLAMYRNALSTIHDALLRDLFDLMQKCYDSKAPGIGPIMYILNEHLYNDELFPKAPEELDAFTEELKLALRRRAAEVYREDMLAKNIPTAREEWEFFQVIQLGKAVLKLAEKIQKRYRKNPVIMGVNPLMILVEEVLPSYAADARELVQQIMEQAAAKGEEINVQDGFDLYAELVEIRRVHADVLPEVQFGFHIEGLLQEFVWRWISTTDAKVVQWVEEAFKQDNFDLQTQTGAAEGDHRHSVSIIDIFRSFNQSIEQIVQLNWDDDIQYAKFMTAMSKSIGNGIARYCELVEQSFAKEMDRLTPEQEAALNQSRQEKWMQLAKDFYANKENVEPFQFLPESLVKLNNIEYAMLQLDKLEREINVDACAEVIQKHSPPPMQRQRKNEKYVFTIKIIEAEDLKACDMNGLSDPYVVLGDEYQKRLAKTRIIYGNLNPRWDETVDIVTTGPLNIIATIWDWDTLGDHDCVGRTSLKLDPSHFRDFMPREYWLDLDTQGRLLLRVSMEGERDDIQFYFGKAFRMLKRTERDMTRNITDKLSSYINHCLSRQKLRSLLSRGISMSSVTSYFSRQRTSTVPTSQAPTQIEIMNALKPLFNYFNENFAIMKQTLTDSAMVMVMTRLWKEVLVTIESLLVPPLSDKPSQQKPLTQFELDIVFKWLQVCEISFLHCPSRKTNSSAASI